MAAGSGRGAGFHPEKGEREGAVGGDEADRRARPVSGRERERGEGGVAGWAGLGQAGRERGVGGERWIFPFYFETHFQEHLQFEF